MTLANTNVYACLVCGKYFQGRGKSSPVYTHSLELGHQVFANLHTAKFYCLPDGYLIEDPALDDIKYNINPTYTKEDVVRLGPGGALPVPTLEPGVRYIPGLVGLNNIKKNDWLNVIVQALSQATPLRDFFLIETNTEACKSQLVQTFGLLFRRIWSSRAFKGHVSPQVFLQAVSDASDRKFRAGTQCDAAQFLVWLLNQLHRDLGGTAKRGSSIIYTTFQGELRVEVTKPSSATSNEEKKDTPSDHTTHEEDMEAEEPAPQDDNAMTAHGASAPPVTTKIQHVPFLVLPIQLPFAPVFAEAKTRSLIHQVKLMDLLEAFAGKKVAELPNGETRKMWISRLPRYLWLHVKRFTTNTVGVEKNNTLVTFPLENLSLEKCIYKASLPSHAELASLSVSELLARRAKLLRKPASQDETNRPLEKSELVKEVRSLLEASMDNMRKAGYSLVANIVHEGNDIPNGSFYCHILNRANGMWYEARDLSITSPEGMAQLVALSQAYIQLYELQPSRT